MVSWVDLAPQKQGLGISDASVSYVLARFSIPTTQAAEPEPRSYSTKSRIIVLSGNIWGWLSLNTALSLEEPVNAQASSQGDEWSV